MFTDFFYFLFLVNHPFGVGVGFQTNGLMKVELLLLEEITTAFPWPPP